MVIRLCRNAVSMLSIALSISDWFIPERSRRSRSDLGRARTFVLTHLVGPASGASIVAFLFMADPSPGLHVPLIAFGIASFWVLLPVLRVTGNLHLVAILSVQTLIAVTLFGVYNYGGVSSPFLAWLLIALANGFFYLSDRPLSVLAIFVLNVAAFIAIWLAAGDLPNRVPMDQMSAVGIVSVTSATLYMAWLAIYYGRLLTSESALEHEAQRHRQTAEQLAEARDKAERASREKSIFLAKMSHELRTPLNAVIGYSEILQEDADLSGDARRAKDLSRITAAGKHLLSLVTDILDITRIEADQMELQIGDFAVARLIEDVAATAAPLAKSNGNRLATRVDPNAGRMASDQLRLRQAALNLMSNAAKFTSNGLIELSARRLRVESGDWIEIEVRDTGIGIAPDDLKNIFQDYMQVNSAEARKRKGTGLGLALSQKLCMMMGGSIFVDSELGHGARFTIRVPAILSADADRLARPREDEALIGALA
jgi:signal transduction histidine kinase